MDELLDAWMDLGPTVAPQRIAEATRTEIRATTQNRPVGPAWFADMNTFARLGLVAAAVVGLALIGMNLIPAIGGVGGPSASSSSTPSPTPQATPSSTTRVSLPDSGNLEIGRNTVSVDGAKLSFEVADSSWEAYRRILIAKSEVGPQGAEAIVYWTPFPEGTQVVACGPWSNAPLATVDQLVNAVITAPGIEVVEGPSDIRVGARPAKFLTVRVRENLGCDPGYFFNWRAQGGGALWQMTQVGDTLRVLILDVDGTPFFIVGQTNADASRWLDAEVEQIMDSIRFE
jgi:hypothetical protein